MKKERHYTVTWTIDEWATSPLEAAVKARAHQMGRGSTATIYEVERQLKKGAVKKTTVDLLKRDLGDRYHDEAGRE